VIQRTLCIAARQFPRVSGAALPGISDSGLGVILAETLDFAAMFDGDPVTQPPLNMPSADGRPRAARRFALGAILLFACVTMSPASAQEFSFNRYTQPAGLRNLGIEQLLFDRTGDMWLATDGGVYRYDGISFVSYDKTRGIPADATMAIAASPAGRIFTRVDAGLYSGDADHFEPLRSAAGALIADQYTMLVAPADDRVLYLKDRRVMEAQRSGGPGSLWSAHSVFSAARIAAQPELAQIQSLIAVDGGGLWFGCGEHLCSLEGTKLKVYGATAGLPEAQYGSILQDRSGGIWARSRDRLVSLKRGADHFEIIDPPHAALVNRLQHLTLTLDPMGHIVTRTALGIARWDGTAWQEFGERNGLPDNPITSALSDSDGNFWLGVSGVGLWRWHGYDNVESWTKSQGLVPETVWNIVRDRQHRLILGTDRGCRMLDEHTHLVVPCPYEGFPEAETNASAVDPSGALWLSYQTSQLWRVPAGSNKAERVMTVPDHFEAEVILFDRSGTGWIAAWDYGVAKIDSATLAVTRLVPPGNPRVDDVTQAPDGTIWVGTTNGLYRIQNDHFIKIPTLVDGEAIGIQTIAANTDGSVWGTRIGEKLLRVAPRNFVANWQDPETLQGATVYSLRTDARGWIWANTGEGVAVYDGHVWRRIEIQDGLVWTDTEQFALYPDDDGSIWVGTARGITHIKDPVRWVRMISRPLRLDIANAQLGRQSLLAGPRPTVKWRDNAALDVAFGSRTFDRSATTQLRYRLLGLSTEWYSSRTFNIHIPALAPGHYQLEAVAVDTPHQRSSPPVTLAFDVKPPWWDTLVFRIFAVLFAVFAVVAAWRWQNRRMQRHQRALEQQHREREALMERATRDALTGLWNRATILEFLTVEMQKARKNGEALAVAVIDVDFFKNINDSFGHAGGDEVLKELARRLRATLRQRDFLGRYGGEELLVVMPGLVPEDRGNLMDALRANICASSFRVGDGEQRVTVSIGGAWLDGAAEGPDELIRRADAALYEAKAAGRNRVVCSTGSADGAMLEVTASRRYLQDFIDRVKRESGKRGVETEPK
jgi:diguanylate cyclase (GGDEF)-like protein